MFHDERPLVRLQRVEAVCGQKLLCAIVSFCHKPTLPEGYSDSPHRAAYPANSKRTQDRAVTTLTSNTLQAVMRLYRTSKKLSRRHLG